MTRPSSRARSRARSRGLAALGSLALLGAVLVPAAQMPAGATSDCGLEGEGTPTAPYLVGSAADLAKVGVEDCELDAHYLQTDDIELQAPSTATYNHTPIAPDYSAVFSGTYDGDGYRITGLTQVLDGTMWCQFGTCFGGLFGNVIGATLRDVHVVDVSITGSVGSAVGNIGALAGFIQDAQVLNSSSTGTIAVAGDAAAGGLIGEVFATNGSESVVRYSFSEVNISNPEAYYVGGLVGSFNNFSQGNARLEDSYARGDVSVDSSAGGLVGELTRGAAHVVSRSYSTGAVVASGLRFGAADDGGLVGGPRPGTVEASSLWSEELSGLATTVGGGTKVTAAQMRDIQTFLDAGWIITATCTLAGFDAATAVWGICPELNNGFPFLRSTRDRSVAPKVEDASATTSSTPVLLGGAAPALAPGAGVWQQADGSTVPLDVTSPAAGQLRYAADGVTVTLTGGAGTSVSNGLVADADGEVACEVCLDLATGDVVEVWMFSVPRLVAAHRVDVEPCQVFSIPVVAPLDGGGPVTAGAHTLQLALPTSSGMQAVNVGVTVGGPVPASVPAGEGQVPSGAALLLLLGAAGVGAGVLVAGRRRVTAG